MTTPVRQYAESSVTAVGTDFLHGNQLNLFERREAQLQFTEPYFRQKLILHQPVLKEPLRMSEHMTDIRSDEMMAYSKRRFHDIRRLEKEFADKIKKVLERQRREEEEAKGGKKDKRARWWHRFRDPDMRDPLKYSRFTNLQIKPDELLLTKDIVILQLTGARLGDDAMTWIGAFLQQSFTIKRIILQGNFITAEGVRNIVLGVRASKSLMELDLSLNPIGDEGVAMICNALQENSRHSKVYQLNFSTCDLTSNAGFYISRLIRDFKQLQSVLLWRNRIGVANGSPISGIGHILEELRNAPHMRLVNLTANCITDKEAADHATVLERAKLKSTNIEFEKKKKSDRIAQLRAEIAEKRARAIWDDERVAINRLERQAEHERQGLEMYTKLEARSRTYAQKTEQDFADRVLKLTHERLVLSRRPLRLVLAGNHSVKPHTFTRLSHFYDMDVIPDFDEFVRTKRRFDNLVIPRRQLGQQYVGPRDIDGYDTHDVHPWDGQFDADYFHERRTAILEWRDEERVKEEEMVLADFTKFKVTDVKQLPPGEREVVSSGFAVTSGVNARVKTVRDVSKALEATAKSELDEEARIKAIRSGEMDAEWEVRELTEGEMMSRKLAEREAELRALVEAKQKLARERPTPAATPSQQLQGTEQATPAAPEQRITEEERVINDRVEFLVPRLREINELRGRNGNASPNQQRLSQLESEVGPQKAELASLILAMPDAFKPAHSASSRYQALATTLAAESSHSLEDSALLRAVTQKVSVPFTAEVLTKASEAPATPQQPPSSPPPHQEGHEVQEERPNTDHGVDDSHVVEQRVFPPPPASPSRPISEQKRSADDITLESAMEEIIACLTEIEEASSSQDRVASLSARFLAKEKEETERLRRLPDRVNPSLATMAKCAQVAQQLTARRSRTDCLLLSAMQEKVNMQFSDEVHLCLQNMPPTDEETAIDSKINSINDVKNRIKEMSEIGSPSDEDLARVESAKKDLAGKKKDLTRYLDSLPESVKPSASMAEKLEQFLEDTVKETDIAFGNSDLLNALIRRVDLPYSELVAQRGLAVMAACDGSQSFLRSLLKLPTPQFDVTELACACFFNQTSRIPLTLALLEFVDISPFEEELGQMVREFFEDIASEKKAIPKEDRKRRINLLRLLLNEFSNYNFNVEEEGADGQSVFTRALYEGDLELVKLLLENKERITNINCILSDSTTPIMQATLGNNPAVVKLLFDTFGEDIDLRKVSQHGNVLDLAEGLGRDQKIIDLLKAKGASRSGAKSVSPAVMTPSKTTKVKVRVPVPGNVQVFGLGSAKPAPPPPPPPKKPDSDDDEA